jgi:hypothetical protein
VGQGGAGGVAAVQHVRMHEGSVGGARPARKRWGGRVDAFLLFSFIFFLCFSFEILYLDAQSIKWRTKRGCSSMKCNIHNSTRVLVYYA